MECRKRIIISSLKVPLYLVSIVPLMYSWLNSDFSRPLIFALSLIFVISSQFLMNTEMDRLDHKYGKNCMKSGSFIPIGPCIFDCVNAEKIRKINVVLLALMVITSALIIIITRLLVLLIIGFLAVILMFAYLYPPLMLYRRGIGELSTFFDFGPLLVLGSYYAFTGSFVYLLVPAAMAFGFIASAVRLSHHIIEESENTVRKKFYIPTFFMMIILSSILVSLQTNMTHIILVLISIIIAAMPIVLKDSQKVSAAAIIYLVIFALIA
ncbi:MAG: prenyltransferase [Conexivisphaerales archaeon]